MSPKTSLKRVIVTGGLTIVSLCVVVRADSPLPSTLAGQAAAGGSPQSAGPPSQLDVLITNLLQAGTVDGQRQVLDDSSELVGPELTTALNNRGGQARNRGDGALARRLYDLSLVVGERADLPAVRALALNNIGLLSYDVGDYDQALDWYRRSLTLSESTKEERGVARTLNNIGAAYLDIGELVAAIGNFERCLQIGERLNDQRVLSNALNNLAIVEGQRGNYVRALDYLKRSYDLDAPTANQRSIAESLLNLGNVYLWQGDYPLAEDHFSRALRSAEDAKVQSLIAIADMDLGQVAEFRGDPPGALRYYERSLAICEAIDDKPYAASVLSFIGSAHLTSGDTASALRYFQRSVDLRRAIGASTELPVALTGLAAAYNQAKQPEAALAATSEAIQAARALDVREAVWRAHLEAGKARLATGDAGQGEHELSEAIATVEALRLDVVGGEFERQSSFANKLEPYHRMIALLADSGRTVDALVYAERAKARVLVDAFRAGRPQLAAAMTEDERSADEAFRLRLASLNARVTRGRPPQSALDPSLANEIDRVRLDYVAFQSSVFARNPQLKTRAGEIDPLKVEDLGPLLRHSNQALVEYVVTDAAVFAFVIKTDRNAARTAPPSVRAVRLRVSSADLTRRVQSFQKQIAARDLAFRKSATDLYALLLAPVRDLLGAARDVTFVPDGALWELPFQALITPAGRFLLDDAAVSYAPSLTALRLMTERRERLTAERPAPRLFAMGNPTWDARAGERVAATYRDADLGSLELAETEVSELAAIYGRSRSQVYVRGEATEARFKAEAGDRQILHIATHGILNDASPLYSHVLLAPSGGDTVEDGLLEAWELLQMRLRAELVVLSACETARGGVTAGEGTIGLSWALFVAGVPTTVLSQWKAESTSTTQLMVEFHRNLKRGLTEARAMRAAALKLRETPAYAHPVYWAPFIVIGAGQ